MQSSQEKTSTISHVQEHPHNDSLQQRPAYCRCSNSLTLCLSLLPALLPGSPCTASQAPQAQCPQARLPQPRDQSNVTIFCLCVWDPPLNLTTCRQGPRPTPGEGLNRPDLLIPVPWLLKQPGFCKKYSVVQAVHLIFLLPTQCISAGAFSCCCCWVPQPAAQTPPTRSWGSGCCWTRGQTDHQTQQHCPSAAAAPPCPAPE